MQNPLPKEYLSANMGPTNRTARITGTPILFNGFLSGKPGELSSKQNESWNFLVNPFLGNNFRR